METKGQRLRILRNVYNLTQKDFCDKFSLKQGVLSRYERDLIEIPHSLLEKLYSIGININWLLFGDGDMFINVKNDEVIAQDEIINEILNDFFFHGMDFIHKFENFLLGISGRDIKYTLSIIKKIELIYQTYNDILDEIDDSYFENGFSQKSILIERPKKVFEQLDSMIKDREQLLKNIRLLKNHIDMNPKSKLVK
jgi:transcriptional regulator with XRE-family HTH domain